MAVKYARIQINAVVSPNSDYELPRIQENFSLALTPDEVISREIEVDFATSNVIDLGSFATVTQVIALNTDTTNYVTATWNNNSTNNSQRILATQFLAFGGLTVSNDLTLIANTAACICRLFIAGT